MQNEHNSPQAQEPSKTLKANGRQCKVFNLQYKFSPHFPAYISQKKLYFRPFSFQKRPETYVGKQTNNPSAPPHEGVVAGTEGPEFLDHVQGDIRICGGLRDLDAEHLAESLRNLGLVLAAQGDRPAARDYLERALALSQATAGEQHIETAWKQAALGTLLYEQGDACAARPHLERALATYCRVLPACHRDVVRLQRLVDSLQQSALQAGA